MTDGSMHVVIFQLAEQRYAIPVTDIAQLIEMVAITALPNAPETVSGVINVRGKIVPIIDLRQRLNLPLQEYALHTPIMLVTLEEHMLGIVVDKVLQVREISATMWETPPQIMPANLTTDAKFIVGVAKMDDYLLIILNIRALLTKPERVLLSELSEVGAV